MSKNSKITYKRLPGRVLRGLILGNHTLWMAGDHILSVDNRGFSESYKRFYFRDIQAITIQQTNRGKIWNSIWVILAGLSALAALESERDDVLPWLIMTGIFVVLLIINWARGPTCRYDIITAVQRETIPSLSRMRTAEKVTRTLRRLIKKTQGEIKPEEISR